jgi:hypothetical protein
VGEGELAAANRFVDASKMVRKQKYGNVHFSVLETYKVTELNGKSLRVTEQEFWTRDNKYFRLDTEIIRSRNTSKPTGNRRRLIAAPDGYVELWALSDEAPMTITGWGDFSDGLEQIDDNFSFQAAARLDRFFFAGADAVVNELFSLQRDDADYRDIPGEYELVDASLSPDGSVLDIDFRWSTVFGGEPRNVEASMKCDVEHGVVLYYKAKHWGDDFSYHFEEEKQYDWENFGCIPKLYFSQGAYSEEAGLSGVRAYSKSYTREITLQSVDWEPVPLGVFSLEGQGLTSVRVESVWSRRLWTLLLGLLLFGIVFLVKWMRQRGSA